MGILDRLRGFTARSGTLSRSSFRILPSESAEDRGHWGSKVEFMLSCIGLSVGLGNVWRFPVLAFENGGAAFLIPYILLQIIVGKPMYFMELAMGQYSGLGPIGVWNMNRAAKGIGVTMCLISLCITIYYNVIMAYTLYFLFASFQTTLPWTVCKEEWENCYSPIQSRSNAAAKKANCSDIACINDTYSPAHLYFYKEVIQRSESLSDMGEPIWYLALCLLLSWIVIFLCLMKGVKSSGKVVYVTATFPYIILIALLIGGCVQDGAKKGIIYYLKPTWSKLLEIKVWKEAAGQMFFSLSVSFGAIIMFGSYNKFKNNVYLDSLIISTTDILTSFVAGFVVFSTLGAMSHESGLPIEEVAAKGFGLGFVAYPEALSRLPVPHMWSIMFFFMLFTLGLDSEFAFLETVLTCLQDEIPRLRNYKTLICGVSSIFCYLVALSVITRGGEYVLKLMDEYGTTFPVMVTACCELVAVQWVYGVRRFTNDVKYMLGFTPQPVYFLIFSWAIAGPLFIAGIIVYSLVYHEVPKYANKEEFGVGVQALGWILALAILTPIPIGVCVAVYKTKGELNFLERLKKANSPTPEWKPQDHEKQTDDLKVTKVFLLSGVPSKSQSAKEVEKEADTDETTDKMSRPETSKKLPDET